MVTPDRSQETTIGIDCDANGSTADPEPFPDMPPPLGPPPGWPVGLVGPPPAEAEDAPRLVEPEGFPPPERFGGFKADGATRPFRRAMASLRARGLAVFEAAPPAEPGFPPVAA